MPIQAKIYYHLYEGSESGQKLPVVLIHGAGGTHLYWPSDVRRLAGYRVYALDLPGHGKSEGRGQQSIPAYGNAILDWMNGIGLHRVVFVGHSMGSAIALSLALDHPEHVLGLGLVGAGARLHVSPTLLESTSSQMTYQNAIDLIVSRSFGDQTSKQLVALAALRMAETRYSVLHGDLLACDVFDVTNRLTEIDLPTLVICGNQDKMTPKRYSQFLVDGISGAQIVIIPDAGHMVMLEKPKTVADALLNFLNGIYF